MIKIRILPLLMWATSASIYTLNCFASDTGGIVKGQVTTISGEVIYDATVTVINQAKQVSRSCQTNSDGKFLLHNINIGKSILKISAHGYASSESLIDVILGPAVTVSSILQPGLVEEVVVVNTVLQHLDMAATTGGRSFAADFLRVMPVDHSFESLALITPGTVQSAILDEFRDFASISGASSAENAYYLNGINVTQIERGLGSISIPWEAISQANVQTSGIGTEFGGALGGILNAVSKSGTNEYNVGIQYRIDPESTYGKSPSVIRSYDPDFNPNRYWLNNQQDKNSFNEWNLWVSGPIVKDKAFFYILLNPQIDNRQAVDGAVFSDYQQHSDRWFTNLQWYLNDQHSIELTAFDTNSKSNTNNFSYDYTSNIVGGPLSQSSNKDTAAFLGFNYHATLSDRLTLDLAWGTTEEEEIPLPNNELPLVEDCRINPCTPISTHSDPSLMLNYLKRTQLRTDFRIYLNDHQLRFGIDNYDIDIYTAARPNGWFTPQPGLVHDGAEDAASNDAIGGWRLQTANASDLQALNNGIPVGEDYLSRHVRIRFTNSKVSSNAFYIQDSWQLNDVVTLNYGLRYTNFKNTVSSGETYANLNGNIAPRLATIWDINGLGKHKVFVSLGRYYQPIAASMNMTQASSTIEYFDYYRTGLADLNGTPVLLQDGSPNRGMQYDNNPDDNNPGRTYTEIGMIDSNLIAGKNLKAMYSDQISFGFTGELNHRLTGSARFVYNEMKRTVEDTDFGPILVPHLETLGIENASGRTSFYMLSNPGEDLEISYDFDQDGNIDNIILSSEQIQLPKPVRKYIAWEFTLDAELNDRLSFNASYTWSHNYGNTEGLIKSDQQQLDPGWTVLYDNGYVMDGAYGNLPNDRRHSLKLSGTYELTDTLSLGWVFRAVSGAPKSVFGVHPIDQGSCVSGPWANSCISQYYGSNSHYDNDGDPNTTEDTGAFVPRGSKGRLPSVNSLDISITYQNNKVINGLSLKAALFNIFGSEKPLAINEEAGPNYGMTRIYQQPRFLSLTARLEF